MSEKQYNFQDAVSEVFDTNDSEREGADLRIDFPGGRSIWCRCDVSVEGNLPVRMKPKMSQIIQRSGFKDDIQYR